jgi:hypothetical protein
MKRLGLALTFLFACGDADTKGVHESDGSVFVGCPPDLPAFALGMEASGEQQRIKARLLSAMPAPPLRYLNDWTVALIDSQGGPLSDAEIVKARPFMPSHGHDGNRQVQIERDASDPSHFALHGLNFIMRGPWEVQLTVRSASAGEDYLVFRTCVGE